MILSKALERTRDLSFRARVAITTLALVPTLLVARNASAWGYGYCYWTCYGWVDWCDTTAMAHVCCDTPQGGNCKVISCVAGLCQA